MESNNNIINGIVRERIRILSYFFSRFKRFVPHKTQQEKIE